VSTPVRPFGNGGWWVAPLTALAVLGCDGARSGGTADATPGAPAPGAASAAPSVLLELERGPCRGACPEYTVALRDDGGVTFTGRKHVRMLGERQGTVDPAALRRVHDALLAAGVAQADSVYDIDAPRCGPYIPDTPVAILTVRVQGALKRIRFEPGCGGTPPYLPEYATRIDSLADTPQWVRRQEGTP
jgi:hypothetical protein